VLAGIVNMLIRKVKGEVRKVRGRIHKRRKRK
jgi:hypothetical protein